MPRVHLNHFYIVLDSATYLDIKQSTFMRTEFAAYELRTTIRKDMSYSGLYFYGLNTYFEFFDESNSPDGDQFAGHGIAFGVDKSGALKPITRTLAPVFYLEEESITRQYNGKHIPWFRSVKLKDPSLASQLTLWLMEYDPHFLEEWHPQTESQISGVSRKKILQRYVSILKNIPPKPFFEDVVSLTIATEEPVRNKLTKMATLLGFTGHTEYGTMYLRKPDVDLRLIPPADKKVGIQAVTLRVTGKPKGQTVFSFGKNTTLCFHSDKLATWSFR